MSLVCSCTALIPHGNIESVLLHEQNAVLNSLASQGETRFFRFMPLCLFVGESFEQVADIFLGDHGGQAPREDSGAPVIEHPVLSFGLIVHPVRICQNVTPVVPSILRRHIAGGEFPSARQSGGIEPATCGIITAFTPEISHNAAFAFTRKQQLRMNVFKLCAVDFFPRGQYCWEWKITKTKWVNVRAKNTGGFSGRQNDSLSTF